MDDEALTVVPRNVQPRIVLVLGDDRSARPAEEAPRDAEQLGSVLFGRKRSLTQKAWNTGKPSVPRATERHPHDVPVPLGATGIFTC